MPDAEHDSMFRPGRFPEQPGQNSLLLDESLALEIHVVVGVPTTNCPSLLTHLDLHAGFLPCERSVLIDRRLLSSQHGLVAFGA
jgi:hypothetical protein